MLNVFFYETFEEERKLLERHLPKKIKADFSEKILSSDESENPPAKIISIRTHSRIPKNWENKISSVLSRTTGTDHLKKYLLPCGYLPSYCSRAAAEQSIMFSFALLRKLPKQIKHFYNFNRSDLTGREVKGKNVSVFGVGNIGYEICKISESLGMKVTGVDIVKKYPDVDYKEPDDAISKADIIICSMDLNENNHNYFNYDFLKKSKEEAIFVNVSRGELSNPETLLKLINEKHLSGIALDVYEKETLLAETLRKNITSNDKIINAILELSKKENVILTPHNAFNSIESLENKVLQSVKQIINFIDNGKFIWEVSK